MHSSILVKIRPRITNGVHDRIVNYKIAGSQSRNIIVDMKVLKPINIKSKLGLTSSFIYNCKAFGEKFKLLVTMSDVPGHIGSPGNLAGGA